MYKGGDNMNIDNIKDNEYMTEEYIDQEIIADNDDGHNLPRIAHEIVSFVEGFEIDNMDVGATDFYDGCKSALTEDYPELDNEECGEVLKIIRENYL